MVKIVGRVLMDPDGSLTMNLEQEDGKQKEICFSAIRCGVRWPTSEYPGYYCIVGLLYRAKPGQEGSLLFLGEGQQDLFRELTEDVIREASVLRFSEIYTEMRNPEWMSMNATAAKMIRENGSRQNLRLLAAPFADNFNYGRDLIRQWGKNGALKIPENSILHRHMVTPGVEKIPEGAMPSLYPIHALRYAAVAFDKIPVRARQEIKPDLPKEAWT